MERLAFNSQLNGKFTTEVINGRDHVVAKMVPIVGDSVMNRLYYPADEVNKAFPQLNNILAPAGHPEIDGIPTSANSALAINKHNFGAFVRNPKLNGKTVESDLVIDTQVASATETGRAILENIRSGSRMGVSTGLMADVATKKGGRAKSRYHGVVSNIQFDHVAVLLDEEPAGDSTFTLNKRKGKKMEDEMIIDLTSLALKDRLLLSDMNAAQLLNAVNKQPTLDEAVAVVKNGGLFVNKATESSVDEFLANKADFEVFQAKNQEQREEKQEFILKNSKEWKKEQIQALDDSALNALVNSVKPQNKFDITGLEVDDEELVLIEV